MRTYKLTISYDGSRYQGWQRQATTDNTIQYILEWSIGKLVGYRVHIDGSGRTDAGVHARGQVASVKLSKLYDTKELKDSLNRYLPEDIRIVKVELAKNGTPPGCWAATTTAWCGAPTARAIWKSLPSWPVCR